MSVTPKNLELIGIPQEFWSYRIDSKLQVERDPTEMVYNYPPERPRVFSPLKFNNVTLTGTPKEPKTIIDQATQRKTMVRLLTDDAWIARTSSKILIVGQTDVLLKIILSVLGLKFAEIYGGSSKAVKFISPSAYSDRISITPDLKFLGIYNLFGNSNDYRLQEVRDLINSIKWKCPVVIAAGGVDEPYLFCKEKLHIKMSQLYKLTDSVSV